MARPPTRSETSGGRDSRKPRQLTLQPRVVFGIDQAQRHGTGAILPSRAGDFRRRQARAEIGDVPAEIRRRRADEERAEFVNLSRRCRHHEHRRALRSGERLGGVPEKNPNDRSREMFMRGCDGAVPPQVADGLRERSNDALQQPLRAQFGRGAFQRLLQRSARRETSLRRCIRRGMSEPLARRSARLGGAVIGYAAIPWPARAVSPSAASRRGRCCVRSA